jgi:hypothetical protein
LREQKRQGKEVMSKVTIKIIIKYGMVIGVYDVENDKWLREESDYKIDNHDQYEEEEA